MSRLSSMDRYAVRADAGVNEAPPPVQAMTADTAIYAAVRFCDDVLASPTVTLMPARAKYTGINAEKIFTWISWA